MKRFRINRRILFGMICKIGVVTVISVVAIALARTSNGPRNSPSPFVANCNVDQPFILPAGCKLPFKGRTGLDVDKHCPVDGCGNSPGSKAQDQAKNNFCSTKKAVKLSFKSFTQMQAVVDTKKSFDYKGTNKPLSADRSGLSQIKTVDVKGKPITLSEGDVVTIVGIVKDAKHDDVPLLNPQFHGEGVNCNKDDVEFNDIHVVLVDAGVTNECESVTAEIIPHFRPESWDRFDSNPRTSPKLPKPGLPVAGLKVRLTGQLFFDGSHAPCGNPFKGSSDPLRRASWEIHPVYKIEVFVGGKFISFDDWAKKH